MGGSDWVKGNHGLPSVASESLHLDPASGPSGPDQDPGPEFLEALANLHARKVFLGRRATPALMEAIGRMPALEVLSVGAWDADARLGPAPRLKELSARTVPDLPHLAALPALEKLTLRHHEADGALDLGPLGLLPKLTELSLDGEVYGLEPLLALTSLEKLWLRLRGARVDPAPIGRLTTLSDLCVTGLRPCSLAIFSSLDRLSRLMLDWQAAEGAEAGYAVDAAALGRLGALRHLLLRGPLEFDDAVAMIFGLESLVDKRFSIELDCSLPDLLQACRGMGSIGAQAAVARALIGSSLPRVVPPTPTQADPKALKKTLAPLREAMKIADDPREIVVALRALDRPALEAVAAGTGLGPDGKLVFGPYLEKECRAKHRADVALYLLDMLRLLDGVRAIDLRGHRYLMDLGPLERHLGTLEFLDLTDCPRFSSLDSRFVFRATRGDAAVVKALVEAALACRTSFDWPSVEADGPAIPPALAVLFETPDPERLREAVSLAASLGLADHLLADCVPDPAWPFGVRRRGLLRSKCPDCGGTGHVTRAARAKLLDLRVTDETTCPTCEGTGEPADAAEAMTHALLALLATLPTGNPTAKGLVGHLTEVRASKDSQLQLSWLKHLNQLTTLEAPWRLCEEALETLKRLPALSRLELSGLPDDLSPIAGLTRLKHLALAGGGAVDGQVLAGLDALETLGLDDVTLTNPQALSALPKLKAVS